MISERIRSPLLLFDVRDKVAIITGASGSFGHACAVALGALGAKLLLASGTADELEAVAKDVRDVGGQVASIVRRPDALTDPPRWGRVENTADTGVCVFARESGFQRLRRLPPQRRKAAAGA